MNDKCEDCDQAFPALADIGGSLLCPTCFVNRVMGGSVTESTEETSSTVDYSQWLDEGREKTDEAVETFAGIMREGLTAQQVHTLIYEELAKRPMPEVLGIASGMLTIQAIDKASEMEFDSETDE